ncbi:MAG TPA: HEXXH motif domain-containing protein [Streptosporangiaceae bacterium]|nr:HEXXH motif domain-containing protein [Streptosporangiaceae bacterium]
MIGAQPGGLRAIAAAAAIRAGISTEIEVPTVSGLAMLPSLGGAAVDDGVAVVRQGADGAEVLSAGSPIPVPGDPNQEAPGWFAVRQLRAGSFTALIDDVDPFRMPAEPTVADRLRSADIDRWNTVLQEAWALLVTHHSDIARELAAAIRSVVPLAPPAHGQVSTSSAETFGAVALSKPPDARVFAVTLVHEVQHLKLSALLDIVRLVSPDDGRLFYAPWRDDPRPVGGLLQGAYAYVGVSRFWRKQRLLDRGDDALGAHAEFARWRAAALFVVETLEVSGGLTPAGMEFVQGMAHTLRGWQEEAVPKEAQQLADDDAQEHLARWQSANGPVPA